jgi:hypothetical protein
MNPKSSARVFSNYIAAPGGPAELYNSFIFAILLSDVFLFLFSGDLDGD